MPEYLKTYRTPKACFKKAPMRRLHYLQRINDYRRICDDEFQLRMQHRPDTLEQHTMDGKPYAVRWA